MTLPDFLTEDPDGFLHVTGHRIGLEHLVHYYNDGYSPEMLACEYPTLPLSLIHRLIAFYLDHRAEVDPLIAQAGAEIARQRAAAPQGPSVAELRARLNALSGAERM